MLKTLGIPLMEDRIYDGVDLLTHVTGKKKETAHEAICWRSDYLRSVRKGKWKLIEDRLGGETVLFNFKNNNYEKTNVYDENPQVVKDLIAVLDKWESQCDNPKWPRVMNFKFTDNNKEFYFPL
jgi:arylsulfatase A-like enzyme